MRFRKHGGIPKLALDAPSVTPCLLHPPDRHELQVERVLVEKRRVEASRVEETLQRAHVLQSVVRVVGGATEEVAHERLLFEGAAPTALRVRRLKHGEGRE